MQKEILITGANGFVGRVVHKNLKNRGYVVHGVDKYDGDIPLTKLDLKQASTEQLISLFQNKTVIHLAAISSVDDCVKNPTLAFEVNCSVISKIVDAVNQTNSELIFASTEWVYPENNSKEIIHSENFNLNLNSINQLYSLTKLIGEWYIQKNCAKKFAILRFGIIYGERMEPQSVFEKIVYSIFFNKELKFGSPETSRRFINVLDIADGIANLLEKGLTNRLYNLAGNDLVSIGNLLDKTSSILGKSIQPTFLNANPSIRNPLSDRFYNEFNWKPTISTETGIERLIKYYDKIK